MRESRTQPPAPCPARRLSTPACPLVKHTPVTTRDKRAAAMVVLQHGPAGVGARSSGVPVAEVEAGGEAGRGSGQEGVRRQRPLEPENGSIRRPKFDMVSLRLTPMLA